MPWSRWSICVVVECCVYACENYNEICVEMIFHTWCRDNFAAWSVREGDSLTLSSAWNSCHNEGTYNIQGRQVVITIYRGDRLSSQYTGVTGYNHNEGTYNIQGRQVVITIYRGDRLLSQYTGVTGCHHNIQGWRVVITIYRGDRL